MYRVFGSLLRRMAALTLLVTVSACSNQSAGLPNFLSQNGDSAGDISANDNANTDNLYRVHLRVGRTALQNQDYITAIYFLERAHSTDKTRVAPLLYAAKAYLALKSDDRAEAAFRKILALDNDHVDSHRQLADLLVEIGKYKESLTHLETALKIAPSVKLHNRAGVVYDLLGNRAKAQAHYRAGLDLDPDNTSLRNNLKLSRLKDTASSTSKPEQIGSTGQVSPNIPFILGPAQSRDGEKKTATAALASRQEHIQRRNTETNSIENNSAITKPYLAKLIPDRETKSKPNPIPENSTPLPAMAKKGYSVQLAAYKTVATARRGLNKLAGWLDDKDAGLRVVRRKQVAGTIGNVKYRIRTITWQDRVNAAALCDMIKNRNGRCIVVKQSPGLWETIPATAAKLPARPKQPDDYRIQFGAYPDVATIKRGLLFLDRIIGSEAPEIEILVRTTPIAVSATNYRIRSTPFGTRMAAKAVCDAVLLKGADCFVIRHDSSQWRPPG